MFIDVFMDEKREKKPQLNTRPDPKARQLFLELSDAVGWNRDELQTVIIGAFIGTKDRFMRAKIAHAKEVAKELSLSFEGPEHQRFGIAA